MTGTSPPSTISEAWLLRIIAAVQFVNILDFMMVMPLGPDFSAELGIPPAHLGVIGGSYTAAAAVAGIAGATFLDRFDRRSVLVVSMLGLALGTVLGAFSWSLETLIAARVLAGVFGGPATAASLSMVADVVPPERRGRAMGVVMGAFSVASVLGVPAGLELAHLGGWRTPFYVVGGLGFLATLAAAMLLPSMRGHIGRGGTEVPLLSMLRRGPVAVSLLCTGLMNAAGFALIPNISPFMLYNVGYPREKLGLLYMFGGVASFICLRLAGPMVDRLGTFALFSLGTGCLVVALAAGFLPALPLFPAALIFPIFMGSMSTRNVAFQALASQIPAPAERARQQSAQSATQHMAAAVGAVIGSQLLDPTQVNRIVGMDRIAALSITLTLTLFPLVWWLSRRVQVGDAHV